MGRHGLHRSTSFLPLTSTSSCIEPSFLPFCLGGNVCPLQHFIIISLLLPWVWGGRKGETGRVKGGRDERWKGAWQTNKLYGHIQLVERRASRAEKGQPHHLVWKIQSFWNESLYTDKYFHVSVFPCGENVALGPFRTGSYTVIQRCLQYKLDRAWVSACVIHSLRIKFYLGRYRLLHTFIKAAFKKLCSHYKVQRGRVTVGSKSPQPDPISSCIPPKVFCVHLSRYIYNFVKWWKA